MLCDLALLLRGETSKFLMSHLEPGIRPLRLEGVTVWRCGPIGRWWPGVYRIEWSEDLRHWKPLLTVTNTAEGEERIVDPEASQLPRRFYRAVFER